MQLSRSSRSPQRCSRQQHALPSYIIFSCHKLPRYLHETHRELTTMSYWDPKTKIIVQNSQGDNLAVKNRFAPSDSNELVSLPSILARLQSGEIEYDSLVITVRGVQRESIAPLLLGVREEQTAREGDTDNRA